VHQLELEQRENVDKPLVIEPATIIVEILSKIGPCAKLVITRVPGIGNEFPNQDPLAREIRDVFVARSGAIARGIPGDMFLQLVMGRIAEGYALQDAERSGFYLPGLQHAPRGGFDLHSPNCSRFDVNGINFLDCLESRHAVRIAISPPASPNAG
jgi:hypothetical protein